MKLSGKITQVMPLQTGLSMHNDEWRKLSFVAMDDNPDEPYPDEILFDLWNSKIPETELKVGQHVDVYYGIRTREYNGRVYNDLNVVRIVV